jgi:hypothetical protein
MLFEVAKKMNWHIPQKTSLNYMGFGLIKGPDG